MYLAIGVHWPRSPRSGARTFPDSKPASAHARTRRPCTPRTAVPATPGEEQVVALVAVGLGNRQIAGELNLSQHTIKKYLFHIFEKLGVSTRVELVLYAVNNGDPRQAEWLAGRSRIPPRA